MCLLEKMPEANCPCSIEIENEPVITTNDKNELCFFADKNDKEPTFVFEKDLSIFRMGQGFSIELYKNLSDEKMKKLMRKNVSSKILASIPAAIVLHFKNANDFWECWNFLSDYYGVD